MPCLKFEMSLIFRGFKVEVETLRRSGKNAESLVNSLIVPIRVSPLRYSWPIMYSGRMLVSGGMWIVHPGVTSKVPIPLIRL